MKLKVNPEYASLNPPLSPEEYEDLKASIKHDGIRTDLHVLRDGTILCGHNRYKIGKELDIPDEKIPHKIVDIPDEIDRKIYVIADNLYRRQLTTPWRIELTSVLDTFEREKAEQRRKSTLKKGNKAPDVENLPPRDKQGKSRDKLGEKAGVSGKTYEKAIKVKEQKPEIWRSEVLEGKKSIDKAYREIVIVEKTGLLPEGNYQDFGSLSNPNEILEPSKKKMDTIICKYCQKSLFIKKQNGKYYVE
jgi:ParB-like chromosome segregation protein Spo0J